MNAKSKAILFHQLATLLNAGHGLDGALTGLARDGGAGATRALVLRLAEYCREGNPLSDAMATLAGSEFGPMEIAITRAGERSGRLPETIKSLAVYHEEQDRLHKRIVNSLWYPAFLIHIAILIPGVSELVTKGLGGYLRATLPSLLILYGIVGLLWLVRALFASIPVLALGWDAIKLHLPIIGPLFSRLAWLRVLHTYSCLHDAGVAEVQAVRLAADTAKNLSLRRRLHDAGAIIETGEPLSVALEAACPPPPLVLQMLRTGEMSGRRVETLRCAMTSMQEDVTASIKRLTTILPILIFLAIAAYVAYLVIHFYQGYFQQIDDVSK